MKLFNFQTVSNCTRNSAKFGEFISEFVKVLKMALVTSGCR